MWDTEAPTTLEFSQEQEQLLQVASAFARDKFPMQRVRARIAASEDFDRAVWTEMASLGWLGIAIAEEFGGSGLGLAEVTAIAEPLGRNLAGTPLLSTTLAAQALAHAGVEAHRRLWLPKIIAGAVATLALFEPHGDWNLAHLTARAVAEGDALALTGVKTFVTDATSADLMIASVLFEGKPALLLLDRAALSTAQVEREIVIDETRRSYRVRLDGVSAPRSALLDPARTPQALKLVDEAACLLFAAELCGAAAGVISITVEYLKTRKQFDRPIGAYQALKHPMVEALLGLEAARSHLYYAASVFGQGVEGEIAVRMAKALAGDALAFAADRAIQFHGGFGFTYDCDAHLYRRRGLWCEVQHGDSAHHRAKLAELVL